MTTTSSFMSTSLIFASLVAPSVRTGFVLMTASWLLIIPFIYLESPARQGDDSPRRTTPSTSRHQRHHHPRRPPPLVEHGVVRHYPPPFPSNHLPGVGGR